MTEIQVDWDAQRKRAREIRAQNIKDPKFQTRPLGRAPLVPLDEKKVEKFNRKEIEQKAKDNAVNVYTRPSHRRHDFD